MLDRMHNYLGGTINGLGCKSLRVGGTADHVHLLVGIGTKQCVADIVREIKKASTNWAREEIPAFAWQAGYAAFSVSSERLNGVIKYIEGQPEHHHKMTFEEERVMLFKMAGIEFDPADLK